MHKQICSLLLAMAAGLALANPQDWCLRPEANDYRALDLKPGSGVKSVVYPNGMGYDKHRTTYSLSPDGLLRSIRTEYPGQDCVESLVRGDSGKLLARTTTCAPKPSSSQPTNYQYKSDGWSETNDVGTEITTVEPIARFGAAWRVHVDLARSRPPGSFQVTHFDDSCREVGPHSFTDTRYTAGGPVLGPTITFVRSITPRTSGYERTTLDGSRLRGIETFGDHGFVLIEQFFDLNFQRSPFAVQETTYQLDTRRNWTSKTTKHRNLREGGSASQAAVVRELSYH